MAVIKLSTRRIEKVWGRRDLSPWFPDVPKGGEKVGEIWYEMPDGRDAELLIKYLFTSEKLSVQVHPTDADARAAGYKRGKEEAWLILAVEEGATVGLGTVRPLSAEDLRAAALDGSIEELIDWKRVTPGQFIYSPAGTVHAIGPGVTLVEVQQNVDLTYRLYDYGRPRELHLDEGVAAATAEPYEIVDRSREAAPGRRILCEGGKFVAERIVPARSQRIIPEDGQPVWITMLAGAARNDEVAAEAGEVLFVDGPTILETPEGTDLLLAYSGGTAAKGLLG
ncbi:class I mannose-6-phosphate isomerase [Pacificimonas flava]|uniref:Mannose-6-phosphate isomerase n=1 Tax=Pacificimonas flava TaxID=1234595 RepID=M2U987_9SPHN|nr:class I mannose-6-phosphate isomerase [Pacificimonas flava]EMD84532.1 Mannose-6-phosphate isomerase [Pacificimonas flava]MBB5279596.1 mannose-6-phosphate isomerase [Pacificimonas flava]